MSTAASSRIPSWLLPALIVVLLAFAVNVQPASAKGEIRASLDQPLPTDVAPGTTIPVAWKLEVRDEQTDKFVPFGAGPVFVRLIGDNPMQATQAVVDSRRGGYSAKVTVPPGGIKNVQIGFQALPASRGGIAQPEYFIPIAGQKLVSPPHVVEDNGPSSVWFVLIVAIGTIAIALTTYRRRRRAAVTPIPA